MELLNGAHRKALGSFGEHDAAKRGQTPDFSISHIVDT